MNDKERQKLVYRLRQTAIVRDIIGSEAAEAANEIERLATKCSTLERDLEWTRERVKNLEQRLPLVGVTRG